MGVPKVGFAFGKCNVCGREYRVKRPAPDFIVCDCYQYCPLEGWTKPMQPYTPDLTPSTYQAEESFAVKDQAVEKAEASIETLYVCNNHSPPYYSSQKPVEVKLS